MKSIIDGKLYDTEKAENIYSFKRKVNKGPVFWSSEVHWTPWHSHNLYKTKKGNYFEYDTEDDVIKPLTKSDAEDIVRSLDPDRYTEIFGYIVEEA